jgi:hypothetical protein
MSLPIHKTSVKYRDVRPSRAVRARFWRGRQTTSLSGFEHGARYGSLISAHARAPLVRVYASVALRLAPRNVDDTQCSTEYFKCCVHSQLDGAAIGDSSPCESEDELTTSECVFI